MPTATEPKRALRFGVHEVDLSTGELRRSGVKVSLQDQPFRVLAALIERPGELITRDELRARVWPDDTFVDFDHALTTAVKKLRRSLNDSATQPRYIETLPKRGYRFVAPVVNVGDGDESAAEAQRPAAELATSDAEQAVVRLRRERWALATLLVLTSAGLAIFAITTRQSSDDPAVRRFSFTPEAVSESRRATVVSPDGRSIAFVSPSPDAALWVRDLEVEEPRRLDGTEGASSPFWSPDSETIGFAARGELRKISVYGGPAQTLAPYYDGIFVGGAWAPDGQSIVYGTGLPPTLRTVSASGGRPTQLFEPVVVEQGGANADPAFLADGVLAFAVGGPVQLEVMVRDLTTGRLVELGPGSRPAYSPSGHLIYQAGAAEAGLWALPFSLRTLSATGAAFPIAASGRQASVSNDGMLVYVDSDRSAVPGQLVWRGRDGARLGTLGAPQARMGRPSISPDGNRVVVRAGEGNLDVWIHEADRPARTRLTTDQAVESDPIWSPRGDEVIYRWDRGGNAGIFVLPVDRSAEPRPVVTTEQPERPTDWSRDGRVLIYSASDEEHGSDIWYAERTSERAELTAKPFLSSEFTESGARLSPDGRLLAYCSDESGRFEVYAREFPDGSVSRQVSSDGGCQPRWSRDGLELFYVELDKLVVVPITRDPTFLAGTPTELFRDPSLRSGSPFAVTYDVAPDAERFVLVEPAERIESGAPVVRIVDNWAAELTARP